ncbi:hypothetical protein BOX15_Mlig030732g1 [Macrostomum lignano]|uniref:Uncharacterized protein n=2 Tax=Macrostomum lignano TaxID=282301 RepID=A0A267G9S3_9PLAT|nr:hypothetical protein BOX15_Mlig024254g2 [Macrostomum lignano]PAA64826.1 hypothetical protein BOX15_Mlig024254g1 [Macrostomum lignano]PAA82771.1 hypothetical protein BOX15_Mlig030732g1 [Macrostomum lignano]
MQKQQVQYVVTSQPEATFVQTGQPVSIGKQQEREWSTGTCGCFEDCTSCVCSLFCGFWYLTCSISKRMNEHCCTPFCVPDTLMMYRLKLRTRYNIEGSVIKDCCCSYFCGPCTMCQLARELKHIESQLNGPAF